MSNLLLNLSNEFFISNTVIFIPKFPPNSTYSFIYLLRFTIYFFFISNIFKIDTFQFLSANYSIWIIFESFLFITFSLD